MRWLQQCYGKVRPELGKGGRGRGREGKKETPKRSDCHRGGWRLVDWLGRELPVSATRGQGLSLCRGFWERLPLLAFGPQGWGWGQSQGPVLPAPHRGRARGQEKDDPPVSESSLHLQLGANSIAGSNLILH